MSTVIVSLEGGDQRTVQTQDSTLFKELESALKNKQQGERFTVSYADAIIIVSNGAEVLSGAVQL